MRKRCVSLSILLAASSTRGQSVPAPSTASRMAAVAQNSGNPSARATSDVNPAEAIQRSHGSLLRATLNTPPEANQVKPETISFFAVPEPTPRTLKKHDLVTILVREESQSKSDASTDLKKNYDFDARLEEFIKFSGGLTGGAVTDPVPSVKFSGNRNFKGEGTADRTDSLTFRVTGEVIDVKPNGTLVLQARQKIKTDDEEQTYILSGICRAEDVTPDNTVLSTQMFDKDLTKTTKGAVRDSTKRGWVPKLLDLLNPF